MIRNQPATKFKMTAKQKALFNRLTTEQQIRLLQVLELKQYQTGCKRVIKATRANKAARAKQVTGGTALDKRAMVLDDSVGITQMYSSHLD